MVDESKPTREDIEKTQECALRFLDSIERIDDIAKAAAAGTRDPKIAGEQINVIADEMDRRYQESLPFIERARQVFRETAGGTGAPPMRLPLFPSRGFLSTYDGVFSYGLKLIGTARRGETSTPPSNEPQ